MTSSENVLNLNLSVGHCDLGWYWNNVTNACYYHNTTKTTQPEAEELCVAQGAHLTSIGSEQEKEFIQSVINDRVFFGLKFDEPSGKIMFFLI